MKNEIVPCTGWSRNLLLANDHMEKWIAYIIEDAIFLRSFDHVTGAISPDGGCNFETFTNGDMLEIESLSPLASLAPGESVSHTEIWHLACRTSGILPDAKTSPLRAALFALLAIFALAGCETVETDGPTRAAMNAAIPSEQPGDYFIGRRMYKQDYKMWGWVREPGKPWKTARLVMMNEQGKLAPDREAGKLGSDNNYEYRLLGRFSGERVYEPASDSFYPEFVLKGSEVLSAAPARIFSTKRQEEPAVRILVPPI